MKILIAFLAAAIMTSAVIAQAAPGQDRVVFIGDSITELWGRQYGRFFPGRPYVNRGVSGQTSSAVLARFKRDVLDAKPEAVVIEAGTNDLPGGVLLKQIEANLTTMAQQAQGQGIKVVIASLLPVCDCYMPQTSSRPPKKIVLLNSWSRAYCARHQLTYIDYYSALTDNRGLLKRGLTYDGLHPNSAGYELMAPLAEQAIRKALGSPEAH